MNNTDKKTNKKLFLKKETLKTLNEGALTQVVGGGSLIQPCSAGRGSQSLA